MYHHQGMTIMTETKKIEKKMNKIMDRLIDMRDEIDNLVSELEYIEDDFANNTMDDEDED